MTRRLPLLALDPAAVVLFATLGRGAHEEDQTLAGIAATAAPFLVAAVAGWLIARAWVDPDGTVTGIAVASSTVAFGMVLRRVVFGKGTAFTFIGVAALFLGTTMIGWRWVARRMAARR